MDETPSGALHVGIRYSIPGDVLRMDKSCKTCLLVFAGKSSFQVSQGHGNNQCCIRFYSFWVAGQPGITPPLAETLQVKLTEQLRDGQGTGHFCPSLRLIKTYLQLMGGAGGEEGAGNLLNFLLNLQESGCSTLLRSSQDQTTCWSKSSKALSLASS